MVAVRQDLADACQAAGPTFVLAHALYLHLIHGGKNKTVFAPDRLTAAPAKAA